MVTQTEVYNFLRKRPNEGFTAKQLSEHFDVTPSYISQTLLRMRLNNTFKGFMYERVVRFHGKNPFFNFVYKVKR